MSTLSDMLAHIRRLEDGTVVVDAVPVPQEDDELARRWLEIMPWDVPFLGHLRPDED